jgi:hypothetical protein
MIAGKASLGSDLTMSDARQRERRRRGFIVIALMSIIGLGIGLFALFGGGTPPRLLSPAALEGGRRGPAAPLAAHSVILRGNGLGAATFGQSESTAVRKLISLLGPAGSRNPIGRTGNCTIDASMQWRTITAYFFHGLFVGYATGSILGGPGDTRLPDATTDLGLRVGDTLAQAAALYGSGFHTAYAQGGNWYVITSKGTIAGLLTSEIGAGGESPRIADVTAGSVGCPAVSP